jgi:hypothetical protein
MNDIRMINPRVDTTFENVGDEIYYTCFLEGGGLVKTENKITTRARDLPHLKRKVSRMIFKFNGRMAQVVSAKFKNSIS